MKLLWSEEKKIAKNKNSENVSHLEITEVVLVYCNLVNDTYWHDSRIAHTLIDISYLDNYWRFQQQI